MDVDPNFLSEIHNSFGGGGHAFVSNLRYSCLLKPGDLSWDLVGTPLPCLQEGLNGRL